MADADYELEFIGRNQWDSFDDNIDVEIKFRDGRRYAATFFTLQNVESLFRKNQETGECACGTYLWAADMILVEVLDRITLETTINGLIENGELQSACSLIPNG